MSYIKRLVFLFSTISSFTNAAILDYSILPGHWIGKENLNSPGYSYLTFDVSITKDFITVYKIKHHCIPSEAPQDKLNQDLCKGMNEIKEMVSHFNKDMTQFMFKSEYRLEDKNTLIMRDKNTGQDRILKKVIE